MKLLKDAAYTLGLPVLLILLWWIGTLGGSNFYVPTPAQLAQTFVDTWFSPRLWEDILPSLGRLFAGLAAAIVFGVGIGVFIGSFRTVRRVLEPLLEFFRAVPPPVLVPLFMLIFGLNDQMRVFVIAFGSVWPILLNTIEGVRGTDEVMRDTASSYRITRVQRLAYLIVPAAGPKILTGVRQSLSIALILMVISEMFGSSSGLGFLISYFQRSFAIPEMWSGILLLGLIGFALSVVFRLIERRILRWYHGLREVQREG
ncbi:ABC transporter permease [Protaetiibacter mangrovi]|uniref:ABC transporter permease n=1 Tax=Protaetiibacter mangrovi TaxID=2970926 RepID=A0ABT1ZGM8_9MICO|nr:ABC transporter permease [Protaetiibacter mangrovi]MCS0499835.1 ABC transporter permease [Protaetiibacter mangrovi]TPX02965.1 ABC transporter permease [Schumannella luteola]